MRGWIFDNLHSARLHAWLSSLRPAMRVFVVAAVSGSALAVSATIVLYGLLLASEPDLPMGADLYAMNRPAAITFLDARGKVAGNRGAIVGERLSLSQMPS